MGKKKTRRNRPADSSGGAETGQKQTTSRRRGQTARPAQVELRKELYFPTHIYFCDLPGAEELNRALLREIHALRDTDPDGIERSNVKRIGSWHSATDLNRREAFARFTRMLDNMVSQVYRDLGYHPGSAAMCDNMWANINPPMAYNRYHNHPNVLWSGVYYVQVPDNAGRIYFRDPREQAQTVTPRFSPETGRPREQWSEVYYEPIAGRAILFPAWLGHEVEPNMAEGTDADGERVSISFNYVQRIQDGV